MILKDWQDSYSVGMANMDKDHLKMIQMINSLYEAMKQGQSKMIVSSLISDLHSYAKEHCSREEMHLASINHQDLENQKKQHVLFLDKVVEFRSKLDSGNTTIAVEMLPYLNEWFINHIMKVDSRYKVTK